MCHHVFSVAVRVRRPCLAFVLGFGKCVQWTRDIVHAFHSKTSSLTKTTALFLSFPISPFFSYLNGPASWPKSALHIFFSSLLGSLLGEEPELQLHIVHFKMEHTNPGVLLFIPERFQRDCSCLLITHPWNLARGRFLHSGDNLKPRISCLLRKRWGTIAGNKVIGLQSKDFPPCEPVTSHPPPLRLQYNYIILLFYYKLPL